LLAATFSDGIVRIFAVPDPEQLAVHDASVAVATARTVTTPGTTAIFVRLAPAFELQLTDTTILNSLWFSLPGRVGILAATSDGHVSHWNLRSTASAYQCGALHLPVFNVKAHPRAITAMAISPAQAHCFVTVGHDGYVRFWDMRDPAQPIHTHMATGAFSTCVQWSNIANHIVFMGMEDGSIRYFHPEDRMHLIPVHSAAVWVCRIKLARRVCAPHSSLVMRRVIIGP
jgi:WD40 repeat protein